LMASAKELADIESGKTVWTEAGSFTNDNAAMTKTEDAGCLGRNGRNNRGCRLSEDDSRERKVWRDNNERTY